MPWKPVLTSVSLSALLVLVMPTSASAQCLPAGTTGLTANYVNEAPAGAFVVTCDIGIYVDTPGTLSNIDAYGTVATARSVQYGIWVHGATVHVADSSVTVDEAFDHQFVSVTFRAGATGSVRGSTLTGAHRVGLLIRGVDTNVSVIGNTIAGTGAKASGWAENGIQVDQGAVARIANNRVSGHWWDGASNWASTGILVASDANQVSNNVLIDNEFSVYLAGARNHASGNRASSSIVSTSPLNFRAWGAVILGDGNHLAGNRFDANNGAGGVYVAGSANRLTGNRFHGFEWAIVDAGTDTMARGNPSPTP